MNFRPFFFFGLLLCSSLYAEDLSVLTEKILRVPQPEFAMGASDAPRSQQLRVADRKLLLNGQSVWFSVAEFSFAEQAESGWRDSLLRCQADGISLLQVPVRWSTHEPRQGAFDWSGQRELKRFLKLADELGLKVILSVGPSSATTGKQAFLPSWLAQKGITGGTDAESYLLYVRLWYAELARQLKGARWKDGGPVLGLQLEGLYKGPATHLLTLKQLALSQGLDFPIYSVSPLATPSTPLPQGAFVSIPAKCTDSLWDPSSMPAADQVSVLSNELPSLALGDFSQRRLNLFLREFGQGLANMETYFPKVSGSLASPATMACFLRSDGNAGFLFLNSARLPRRDLRFLLTLYAFDTTLTLPQQAQPLPANMRSIWPINLPLSNKITLGYATAMPLCILEEDDIRTVFLAAPDGMKVDIGISADLGVKVTRSPSKATGVIEGNLVYRQLSASREPVLEVSAPGSPLVRIVLLSEADSLNLVKVKWLGQTRVLLWRGLAIQDGERLDLYDYAGKMANGLLHVYPNPQELIVASRKLQGRKEGLFTAYEIGARK